jgi:hypothetical protein
VKYSTGHQDLRITAKAWVVGITVGDAAMALPFDQLDQLEAPLQFTMGDSKLELHWDRVADSAKVFDCDGKQFPSTVAYWFAWVAFHPETELYLASDG